MCVQYGLKPGNALGVSTGCGFDENNQRENAMKWIGEGQPVVVIGSPPCIMICGVQTLALENEHARPGSTSTHELMQGQAKTHTEVMRIVYHARLATHGSVLHEHPRPATS